MGELIVVGLGPGDAALLTVEARDIIAAAPEVWLRTARHPTVSGLPTGPRYESFDAIYEREPSFEAVYDAIVGRVLEVAARPEGAVYAVPGHPLFGEATVRSLLLRAPEASISMRIVAGVSFVDTIATALGIDSVLSFTVGLPGRLRQVPLWASTVAAVGKNPGGNSARRRIGWNSVRHNHFRLHFVAGIFQERANGFFAGIQASHRRDTSSSI